jgi:predicted nucleic acid-binding protein
MLAVHGVFDGQVVRLLEPVQLENQYRVVVTFLEPIEEKIPATKKNNLEQFVGMWADFTPEEEQVFQTILEERVNYFTNRQKAAQIYADLRRRGKLIPDADILIAGIALTGGYTLVTQNLKHFQRVTGLNVENWLSS